MNTSSILDLIYFNCSNNPGLTAIDYEGSTITYEELRQELEHSSEKLDLAGIRPGHRVALAVADKSAFIMLWLACWHTGAVPIPFEPVKNLPELERMHSSSHCQYLICDQLIRRAAVSLSSYSEYRCLFLGLQRFFYRQISSLMKILL